ncbi:uncharacterized protein LOC119732015 [Patiria miniata]|uniref:Ig-like domain-containing protein n=1 Tax=Patiria miniata TaxID=46514 RepID=A0A914AD82_PATMI|nr:uncharacterized protein LOC119732015 [Patiria miniata]
MEIHCSPISGHVGTPVVNTRKILVRLMLFALEICTAQHTCPNNGGENVELAFGLSNTQAYLQQGFWHRIPCPTFRSGEKTDGVIWYRGSSIDDPSKVRLLSRSSTGDFPASERYAFLSGFSLLIKGVEEADQGSYLCQVIPQETGFRVRRIYLHVIGKMFPASPNDTSSAQSLQRGTRQTLPCPCTSQTPDVVYWSTGEGVTTDTQIIAARFPKGVTIQIQYGADYSIGSDASLTVNSLTDVQDTQRFWCHVFQQDGSPQNCFTDGSLSDEQQPTDDPLKASEGLFYPAKDTQQILPCLSWTPGDTVCEVEWSKVDNPGRQVLSYSLSTDVVDSSPEFDLASDFGLVIQSVGDDHAGVYRCAVGNYSYKDVEVRVIGNYFLLDGGIAVEGRTCTLQPGKNLTLQCPSASSISMTSKAHLYWSFAAPDARITTVIGTLNLPDGSMEMSDLRDNDCFQITLEGSLLLNNCSQDGDVRFWCHIFPEKAYLLRSFVDVELETLNGNYILHR